MSSGGKVEYENAHLTLSKVVGQSVHRVLRNRASLCSESGNQLVILHSRTAKEAAVAKSPLDALDVRLLRLLADHPRVGVLELSRLAGVARATVSARLERIRAAGIVTGYGPQIDLAAAGYPVQALVTLETAQGLLDDVAAFLHAIAGVVEAYATTGTGDVVCRLAAESNEQLQALLLELNRSDAIRRSVSVVILSTVVAPRVLPLLEQEFGRPAVRSPQTSGGSDERVFG